MTWGQFSLASPNEYFKFLFSKKVNCVNIINPEIKKLKEEIQSDLTAYGDIDVGLNCFASNSLIEGEQYPIVVPYIFNSQAMNPSSFQKDQYWNDEKTVLEAAKENFGFLEKKLVENFKDFGCAGQLFDNRCFTNQDEQIGCSYSVGENCLLNFPPMA